MDSKKERPIVLTAEEVNAVLAGHKTQHRAPVLTSEQLKEGFEWDFGADGDSAIFIKKIDDERQEVLLKPCPFGAEGDRLWVQEGLKHRQPSNVDCCMQWAYASDNEWALNSGVPVNAHKQKLSAKSMPRWASRSLLEITDIRIERVQDITHSDSVKEAAFTFYPKQAVPPLSAFPRYWMAKHGDDAWRLNPWVWVIEFKVIKPSEVISE